MCPYTEWAQWVVDKYYCNIFPRRVGRTPFWWEELLAWWCFPFNPESRIKFTTLPWQPCYPWRLWSCKPHFLTLLLKPIRQWEELISLTRPGDCIYVRAHTHTYTHKLRTAIFQGNSHLGHLLPREKYKSLFSPASSGPANQSKKNSILVDITEPGQPASKLLFCVFKTN